MDFTVTMAMLASGPGAWVVTNGALLALNAGLGKYFNELANRLTAMILPIILVELAILASGTTDWTLFVVGFFTGLLASVGTKTSQTTYDEQIAKAAVTDAAKLPEEVKTPKKK